MCAWRGVGVAWAVALGLGTASDPAGAETFQERWWPIPPAHTAPSPPPASAADDAYAQGRSQPPYAEREPQAAAKASPATHRPQPPAAKRVFFGRASFYAYRGGKTASGASFNPHQLTAAHRTLPFGTRLRVSDPQTGKSVEVVITDRGPATKGRVLDLSLGAAKALGIGERGVTQVRAEIISG